MKKADIEKLKKDLLKQTKTDDKIRSAKIERYISFLYIDMQCDEEINRDGPSIVIENGSQRFTKRHPSIDTKLDIYEKIELLEQSLGIASNPSPSSTVEGNGKSGGLI